MSFQMVPMLNQRTILTTEQVWNNRWKKHGIYAAAPTAFLGKAECEQYEQEYIDHACTLVHPWLIRTQRIRAESNNATNAGPCILADVPCGSGNISLHPKLLNTMHTLGWNILAADISQEALSLYTRESEKRSAPPTTLVNSDIVSLLRQWVTEKFAPEILLISRAIMHLSYKELLELRELIASLTRSKPWMVTIIIGAYADYQNTNQLKKVRHGFRKNKNTWYPYHEVITTPDPLPATCYTESTFPYFFGTEIYTADTYRVSFIHKTG